MNEVYTDLEKKPLIKDEHFKDKDYEVMNYLSGLEAQQDAQILATIKKVIEEKLQKDIDVG